MNGYMYSSTDVRPLVHFITRWYEHGSHIEPEDMRVTDLTQPTNPSPNPSPNPNPHGCPTGAVAADS